MAATTNMLIVKPRYDLADLTIALITAFFLTMISLLLVTVPLAGKTIGLRDFIAYYATGRQLVHHADPYDAEAIRGIEHSAGLPASGLLLMRNPPWGLAIAYPLGFFNVRGAFVLWSLLLLTCLLIPLYLIRRMHGSPRNHIHWLGLSFTPALICLIMGQTSLLALLGLALFMCFHRTHPFGAGAALWLCTLKPHLFLPFFAVLAAWILFTRAYKVLAGAVLAMAISVILVHWIDPSAFSHYLALMRSPAVEQEFVPCFSDALRFWIRPNAVWLQYLPASLACLWALSYYWRRRANWNWMADGSPLMLVSLLFAPYAWFYDQCLAIPALLHGAYAARSRVWITILGLIIVAADLQLCALKVISPLWLWTAPAWLAWYLFAIAPGDAARQTYES